MQCGSAPCCAAGGAAAVRPLGTAAVALNGRDMLALQLEIVIAMAPSRAVRSKGKRASCEGGPAASQLHPDILHHVLAALPLTQRSVAMPWKAVGARWGPEQSAQ